MLHFAVLTLLQGAFFVVARRDQDFTAGQPYKYRMQPSRPSRQYIGHIYYEELAERFAEQFRSAVTASKKLSKRLDASKLTKDTASELAYDIIYRLTSKVGNPDAFDMAHIAKRAVIDNFYQVQHDSLVNVYATCIPKYLSHINYLTSDNVDDLAQNCVKSLEHQLDLAGNRSPEANIRAVSEAPIVFLHNLGLLDAKSVHEISKHIISIANKL